MQSIGFKFSQAACVPIGRSALNLRLSRASARSVLNLLLSTASAKLGLDLSHSRGRAHALLEHSLGRVHSLHTCSGVARVQCSPCTWSGGAGQVRSVHSLWSGSSQMLTLHLLWSQEHSLHTCSGEVQVECAPCALTLERCR